MMEPNTYPKNLEGFILLEKLKEQQKSEGGCLELQTYDYSEPLPLQQESTNASS